MNRALRSDAPPRAKAPRPDAPLRAEPTAGTDLPALTRAPLRAEPPWMRLPAQPSAALRQGQRAFELPEPTHPTRRANAQRPAESPGADLPALTHAPLRREPPVSAQLPVQSSEALRQDLAASEPPELIHAPRSAEPPVGDGVASPARRDASPGSDSAVPARAHSRAASSQRANPRGAVGGCRLASTHAHAAAHGHGTSVRIVATPCEPDQSRRAAPRQASRGCRLASTYARATPTRAIRPCGVDGGAERHSPPRVGAVRTATAYARPSPPHRDDNSARHAASTRTASGNGGTSPGRARRCAKGSRRLTRPNSRMRRDPPMRRSAQSPRGRRLAHFYTCAAPHRHRARAQPLTIAQPPDLTRAPHSPTAPPRAEAPEFAHAPPRATNTSRRREEAHPVQAPDGADVHGQPVPRSAHQSPRLVHARLRLLTRGPAQTHDQRTTREHPISRAVRPPQRVEAPRTVLAPVARRAQPIATPAAAPTATITAAAAAAAPTVHFAALNRPKPTPRAERVPAQARFSETRQISQTRRRPGPGPPGRPGLQLPPLAAAQRTRTVLPMSLTKAQLYNVDSGQMVVECHFNPEELTISRSNTWSPRESAGSNLPDVHFGGMGPRTVDSLKLIFDTYERKSDVRDVTNKVMGLMDASAWEQTKRDRQRRPPHVMFRWGAFETFPGGDHLAQPAVHAVPEQRTPRARHADHGLAGSTQGRGEEEEQGPEPDVAGVRRSTRPRRSTRRHHRPDRVNGARRSERVAAAGRRKSTG